MYKPGQIVKYRHPYAPDVILTDEIFEVHKEIVYSKNGETTKIWYKMFTCGDVHHVGNHVDESQIISLCGNQGKQ